MHDIVESTKAFEAWMKRRADISRRLLEKKHGKMAEGPFPFLRATFYRWVEQWPSVCRRLAQRDEDVLLAVGDLHVENFGVWNNSVGRSVWGVNDFDDACELPFTSDLVRLATSVALAAEQQHVPTSPQRFCKWLLAGYRTGLRKQGEPILVAQHQTLRVLTDETAEDPSEFWKKKLDSKELDRADLPAGLEDMFQASFPRGARLTYREQKNPGGLGSLGRRRYTALVNRRRGGGYDAREAKALVPSALNWLTRRRHMPSLTATLLQRAIRSPDPYFQVHDQWLIRQLAPDVAKIDLPKDEDDVRLPLAPEMLRFMGWETANVHLGSRAPEELQQRLDRLEHAVGKNWLVKAAEDMTACTKADARQWRKHWKRQQQH
jgi:Uncharacterized protein conserved in bacteria (DUF2252)